MEDTTPDFQDLLAAFDIPDMRVKISEVRSLAPVTSASDVASTTPSDSTAVVKQEPNPTVNISQPSWQPAGQVDNVSRQQQHDGLQALEAAVSAIDKTATNTSSESPAIPVLQIKSSETRQNGSVIDGDGLHSFFKPLRETDIAQHAKVVSSTLQANSWANAKSVNSSVVSIAPKPVRAQKTPPSLASVQRFPRPSLSAANVQIPNTTQKSIPTTITATVHVNMVNRKQPIVIPISRNAVPPLIFGRSSTQQASNKSKAISEVTNSGSKTTITETKSIVKPSEGSTVQVSPAVLLKRLNPIPRYIPKAKQFYEWRQSEDASQVKKGSHVTHPCEECGDVFLVESSLTLHMERRSLQIAFICVFCFGRSLLFYNKCSFYAHLRKHSQLLKVNISYSSQIARATVSSLNNMKPNPSVVVVSISSETETTKSNPDAVNSSMEINPSHEAKQPSAQNATIVSSSKIDLSHKCNLCGINFKTETALHLHMQFLRRHLFKCQTCQMDLPSMCQVRAHTIMHTSKSCSWVCPECSQVFTSLRNFSMHTSNTCMHWYRQMRTECTLCSKLVINYTQHLDKGHEMLFYRCVSCAMAFKTLQALKEHSEEKHQVQPGSPLCRIISKCPFCETVFMQKPLLLAHIQMHVGQDKQLKRKYVYNCPMCNTVCTNLSNIKKHLIKTHKNQKHFHCDFCHRRFLQYSDLLSHFKTGTPTGLPSKHSHSEETCKASSSDRLKNYQGSVEDMKETESKSSSEASESSSSNSSNDAKPKEQTLSKLYVKKTRSCPGCRKDGKVIFFQKETDLRSHMSLAHPEMKLSVINSDDCVKYVTIKPKECNPQDTNTVVEKSSPASDDDSRKRKMSPNTAEGNHTRKKAKFTLPTEFDCVKCSYHSSNRSEFKVHIESHRPDRSFSQCEECGTCFRIEAALQKHLFIQHGIRKFDVYSRMLQSKSPSPIPDENPDEETTSKESHSPSVRIPDRAIPLECQVCYKTFQSEGTLRVHMRNHGMAFIRSKRSISSD